MKANQSRVCIVGLGPAGLGAALQLSQTALAKETLCIDAGVDVASKYCTIFQGKGCRFADPCQIITGVGGSSVLSGGKISLFPAGRGMVSVMGNEDVTEQRLRDALDLFQQFVPLIPANFPRTSIIEAETKYGRQGFQFRYYDAYRYRRADLIAGYAKMLTEITNRAVSVLLNTTVSNIVPQESGFQFFCDSKEGAFDFFSENVVLATGRFGTKLLTSISENLNLHPQPNRCDIGVRLEFPTALWTDIDSCHNDIKLHFGDARTFCVCKDGFIAPYRFGDIFLLEGTSDPDIRTGLTNLAITIRVPPSPSIDQQSLFSDVRRRHLAHAAGKPIRQRLVDFLQNQNTLQPQMVSTKAASIRYWRWGNANACYPDDLAAAIREAVKYLVSRIFPKSTYDEIFVFAPELDYYWPKFQLAKGFYSGTPGLYLAGDSSGLFRGILQAFCSGLTCAEHISGIENVQ